jgi:hypothetical protein
MEPPTLTRLPGKQQPLLLQLTLLRGSGALEGCMGLGPPGHTLPGKHQLL